MSVMFKRIFRYLIKRYVGQYIVNFKSDLDSSFKHGKGSIENIELDVEV